MNPSVFCNLEGEEEEEEGEGEGEEEGEEKREREQTAAALVLLDREDSGKRRFVAADMTAAKV